MDLVDFTTFDDIRASLGVAEAEIGDSTLSLAVYRNNLATEFDSISTTLTDDFAVLPSEDTQSTAQKTFARWVQLFATFAVAKQLTVSLPLFSPKEIGDGKATMTRYAADPYKATVTGISDQYERAKVQLTAAYLALSSSTSVTVNQTYFAIASPTSDPVLST